MLIAYDGSRTLQNTPRVLTKVSEPLSEKFVFTSFPFRKWKSEVQREEESPLASHSLPVRSHRFKPKKSDCQIHPGNLLHFLPLAATLRTLLLELESLEYLVQLFRRAY